MSSYIYVEGGGDSKELHTRCREGFRRLLENCGFWGRMPRLVACGSRSSVFDDFVTAHGRAVAGDYVAMLIDSEDLVADIEKSWAHLKQRDGWDRPAGADDQQVFLMVTCMETWIIADRAALKAHFGACLEPSGLPPLNSLESRDPGTVQGSLMHATRNCKNVYRKGRRSFEVLGKLTPATLARHCPSFQRLQRVLEDKL